MNEETLKRIAEALEGISYRMAEISDRLQGIEDILDSCTATNGRNGFFRITGDIATH